MIEKDHVGDWSPEKDCCRPITFLDRTPIIQKIFFNQSNSSMYKFYNFYFGCVIFVLVREI